MNCNVNCTTLTLVPLFLSLPSSFSESSHLSHIVRNTITLSLPHCFQQPFLPLSFPSISHLWNLSPWLYSLLLLFLFFWFSSISFILLSRSQSKCPCYVSKFSKCLVDKTTQCVKILTNVFIFWQHHLCPILWWTATAINFSIDFKLLWMVYLWSQVLFAASKMVVQ